MIDTVSFRAVSQAATALGFIILVRGMSKEDFGVFNLLYAFIPVISTFASLGLEHTLRRYQPEYLRNGNDVAAQWLVRFVASARFGTNVIFLTVILLSWNLAAPIFKLTPYRAEFALFCLLVLIYFQARVLQLSLAARMLHRLSVGSIALLSIAKLIAYSGLMWAGALTLDRAILADTLAFGAVYLLLLVAYRKHVPNRVSGQRYRPDSTERRRLFRYAAYNNFNDAGSLVLNSKSDNFFIAALIDPVSVGIYAFYTRLNEMARHVLPTRLFDNVIQPMMFSLTRHDADRRMSRLFTLLLNMNLMLQWPVLAFTIAYHHEFVTLVFGDKFARDSVLLPMIVAFSTINVVAIPVTLVAQYEEKAGVILLSKVFTAYNVGMLLLLLPIIGLYGAVIASGSAQAFKNWFIWWNVRDRARWTNAAVALLAGVIVWGTAVLLCYLLKPLGAAYPALNFVVGAIVLLLATLIHVRGPAVSQGDRELLGSLLRGREARALRRIGLLPRTAPLSPPTS